MNSFIIYLRHEISSFISELMLIVLRRMVYIESDEKLLDFIGVNWLRKTLVHAMCVAFFLDFVIFILLKVMRGQSNYVGRRNVVFFAYLEDAARCFKAVHHRHDTIHKYDLEIGFAVFDALLEFLQTLVA